ncbi:hypothetical protein BC629DRAFT_1593453 [Irpex lacteus]|nr:hypothetical protein BC629DRAFT_1593453 [Irpex lacteus]
MLPRIYHMGNQTYLFDLDFWHLKKGKLEDKWEVQYCIDVSRVGNFTRFLNRSCKPNCVFVPVYANETDLQKPMLAIFTSSDILAGQKLCISYVGSLAETGGQSDLQNEDTILIKRRCGSKNCTGKM